MVYIASKTDTVFSVASKCGISVSKLIEQNGLTAPFELTEGETLFISHPNRTYCVCAGDDETKIYERFKISKNSLMRQNPYFAKDGFLYPGEIISISENEPLFGALSVYGYIDESTDENEAKATLPYLSALFVRAGAISHERVRLPSLGCIIKASTALKIACVDIQMNDLQALLKTDTAILAVNKEGFDGICIRFDENLAPFNAAILKSIHEKFQANGLSFFIEAPEKSIAEDSQIMRDTAAFSDGLLLQESSGMRSLGQRISNLCEYISPSTRTRIFCTLSTDCTELTKVNGCVVSENRIPLFEAKRHAHTKKRPMHREDDMGCAYFDFPFCTKGKFGTKRFIFEDARSFTSAFEELARCGGLVCKATEASLPFLYMLSCNFAINCF